MLKMIDFVDELKITLIERIDMFESGGGLFAILWFVMVTFGSIIALLKFFTLCCDEKCDNDYKKARQKSKCCTNPYSYTVSCDQDSSNCSSSPSYASCSWSGENSTTCVQGGNDDLDLVSNAHRNMKKILSAKSLARKIFAVHDLEPGERSTVNKYPTATAMTLNRRGAVPEQIFEGEEVWAPPFEIATLVSQQNNKLTAEWVKKSSKAAAVAVAKEENANTIQLLKAVAELNPGNTVLSVGMLSRSALKAAFAKIEIDDRKASAVVIHSNTLPELRLIEDFEEYDADRFMWDGAVGKIWGATVYMYSIAPGNLVLCVSLGDEVLGHLFVRNIPFAKDANHNNTFTTGAVVFEEIGMVYLDDTENSSTTISAIDIVREANEELAQEEAEQTSQEAADTEVIEDSEGEIQDSEDNGR